MITPTLTPMMIPMEPLVSTAKAPVNSGGGGGGGGSGGGGGGGGATLAIVGCVTTVSTAIETLVTLANMVFALIGLLVAVAIVDCTEAAVAVGVRMRTPTITLPGDMVSSTADGWTPAWAAVAFFIWDCTLGVNEETSPASRRVNPTTLIAGGEGKGEGGGGEGEGGGGEGGSGGEGSGGGGGGGNGDGLGDVGEGGSGGGGGNSDGLGDVGEGNGPQEHRLARAASGHVFP